MRGSIMILAFFVLSISAVGQTAEKTQKIHRLMEVFGYTDVAKQQIDAVFDIYVKNNPTVDSAFWNEFRKEMSVENLTKLIVPIYDKYFTETDLDALIAFYTTPAGVKVKNVLPQLSREAMEKGAAWGKEVGEKIAKKLQEQGYTESQ
jgi:uncharacterized protein